MAYGDETPPNPIMADEFARLVEAITRKRRPVYEDDGVDDGDLELWRNPANDNPEGD